MTLYLDTSSLVKLYVSEPGSDEVRALVSQAVVVATSGIAYPEARAALARCRRERVLATGAFTRAREAFESDWPRFLVVEVSASICREAGELAERHGLRGFDSVHLASYLEVARRAGAANTRFSSHDARLNRAVRTAVRAAAG